MSKTIESFTRLERAVIEKLLAQGPRILEPLRQQVAAASVSRRELTGVGFFTEIVLPQIFPGQTQRLMRTSQTLMRTCQL
jgi:hypothetical protein